MNHRFDANRHHARAAASTLLRMSKAAMIATVAASMFTLGTLAGAFPTFANAGCKEVSSASQWETMKRKQGRAVFPYARELKATTVKCGGDYATTITVGTWRVVGPGVIPKP